jgi:hypothetical protein
VASGASRGDPSERRLGGRHGANTTAAALHPEQRDRDRGGAAFEHRERRRLPCTHGTPVTEIALRFEVTLS